MCGIVGYVGTRPATQVLMHGLKQLEYRGYDSAGICVGGNAGLTVIKRVGKLFNLAAALPDAPFGRNGIAHTRWATHGGVSEANAHPHLDCKNKIAVVHNGIIENYQSIKDGLIARGHKFVSETDTEVLAHLIEESYDGDLTSAVRKIMPKLRGTYGIIVMHSDHPDTLVGVRMGSPLVLGIGDGEMFLASDVSAIAHYTKQIAYLNDGEILTITPDKFNIIDNPGRNIDKEIKTLDIDSIAFEKNGFAHFMLKEIFEQPESIKRGLMGRIDTENSTGKLGGLNMSPAELQKIKRVIIVASGTSYYAGCVGANMIETMAGIPARAELSSEIAYRNPIVEPDSLYFFVSQSGETADTLIALRELKSRGAKVLGIVNAVGSTIAREAGAGVYIHSGPEIAVASTKAFTSQITAFTIFALTVARLKNMSLSDGGEFIKNLMNIPDQINEILESCDEIKSLAKKYACYKDMLFLGRGINYPCACEGALKLKEISYIHAEGFGAGELKHGPIALINENMPCVFLAPDDELREKNMSNMKEVAARNGKIIAICTKGDTEIPAMADDTIMVPKTISKLQPFLMMIPLQLFAYYCALELDRDVDQPRNLAKSVTVE